MISGWTGQCVTRLDKDKCHLLLHLEYLNLYLQEEALQCLQEEALQRLQEDLVEVLPL